MNDPVTEGVILEHDGGQITLRGDTLLFAIDDTGHEAFADDRHPVFGLGGCGCLVRDYERLIAIPWNYMCERFFPEIERPLHAAELKSPSDEQLDALRHFFEKFQFFRVATLVSTGTANKAEADFVNLVGATLLNRIADVAKWAEFDRLFILVEDSDRVGARIMRSLSGKHVIRKGTRVEIELGIVPKSAGITAVEVADFIVHTAGAQTRLRNEPSSRVRKDFEIVFRNVDAKLVSFMEVTRAVAKATEI